METTDIWFASFLKLKGYKLVDFTLIGKGKGKYKFDISSVDWKKEKMEFIVSDISKIKQHMEELKDLLY
jgi:hypothetical protein